jgi:hypothetical protein
MSEEIPDDYYYENRAVENQPLKDTNDAPEAFNNYQMYQNEGNLDNNDKNNENRPLMKNDNIQNMKQNQNPNYQPYNPNEFQDVNLNSQNVNNSKNPNFASPNVNYNYSQPQPQPKTDNSNVINNNYSQSGQSQSMYHPTQAQPNNNPRNVPYPWRQSTMPDGRIFYINDQTGQTSFIHPSSMPYSTVNYSRGGNSNPNSNFNNNPNMGTGTRPTMQQRIVVPAPTHVQTQNQYENHNYMVASFLVCLFCCCIPGLIAMYFSNEANDAYRRGNMEEAEKNNKNAKTWLIVGVVLGAIAWIVYIFS